jgi:nitroreductase
MLLDLIKKNRSCRRFYQDHRIEPDILKDLVELARLSASGANLQPLKYILSCNPQTNAAIFPCLGWAGYLKDWPGPEDGERPSAYVMILGDTRISKNFGCDHGIAAQSILLGAREKGLAGCMIGSIKKTNLRNALDISDRFDILLVLAIGKPKEEIVIEDVGPDDNIRYWRDEQRIHHVPKRSARDIIIDTSE